MRFSPTANDTDLRRRCNQFGRLLVQWLDSRIAAAAIAGCIFGIAALPANALPLQRAEAAVKQLQSGNLKDAAAAAREAIEQDSGESILHNLAATILLISGDIRGAESECNAALAGMPDDGLAHFGLALCALAK